MHKTMQQADGVTRTSMELEHFMDQASQMRRSRHEKERKHALLLYVDSTITFHRKNTWSIGTYWSDMIQGA